MHTVLNFDGGCDKSDEVIVSRPSPRGRLM